MNYVISNQYGGDETDDEIERLTDLKDDLIDKKNPKNKKQINEIREQINILMETRRQNILRPFNNCNVNSIEIDDFKFFLLAYDSKANGNRGILILKSINKENNSEKLFSAYSSKSEGGFWRMCMSDKNGTLIKGDPNTMDYIQGTFLDIKLQLFINSNIDKCPQQEIGDKCFFSENIHTEYIYNQIIERHREINKEPFYTYSLVPGNRSGSRGYSGWTINQRLLELSEKLKKNAEFKIKEYSVEGIYSKENNIDDDILKINGIIIKCFFENNIVLYMLKYKLNVKRKDGTIYDKTGICPIIMTTNESKITEFGIYSNYVYGGNYIGKLFEYGEQIAGDISFPYEILGEKYRYIGSHYNGVYPYTEINNIKLIKDSINILLEKTNKLEIDEIMKYKNIINLLITYL